MVQALPQMHERQLQLYFDISLMERASFEARCVVLHGQAWKNSRTKYYQGMGTEMVSKYWKAVSILRAKTCIIFPRSEEAIARKKLDARDLGNSQPISDHDIVLGSLYRGSKLIHGRLLVSTLVGLSARFVHR